METGYVNDHAAVNAQASYAAKSAQTSETKTGKVSGKTIGEPKLSETAAKYYEQLKKKYSNLDFVLVSEDQKESAQASAASYANANRMVVLIDEAKIEKMATDEAYRKQYEGIISGATTQLAQIATGMGSNASSVKGYGMTVNDGGTASIFAVVDKSLAAQKKRIEEKAQAKRTEKKDAAKKAQQDAAEKRAENAGATDKTQTDRTDMKGERADYVTVTASSPEELLQKIQDVIYAGMSDQVMTPEEQLLGGRIDFSA